MATDNELLNGEKELSDMHLNDIEKSMNPTRVLLVEDNPTSQVIIIQMLKAHGYECHTANNGKEALDSIRDGKYDVVLMDVEMPYLDGIETISLIRKGEIKTKEHLPIIALTVHSKLIHEERCLSAGADGYLVKPLTMDKLCNSIENILTSGVFSFIH